MHKKYILISLLLVFFAAAGCENDDPNSHDNGENKDAVYIFGDLSEDEKAKMPVVPVRSIAGLGEYASDIEVFGDYAYVVDSGNNVIRRIRLDDLTVDPKYVDLGQNAMPYAVAADEANLYVAVQGKKQVIAYPHENPANSKVVFDNLVAPAAVYSRDGVLYAADSEYDFDDPSKTGGRIYVRNAEDGVVKHASTSPNPGFLDYCPTYDFLFSVNAGVVQFAPEFKAPEKSCLDVWDAKAFAKADGAKPAYTLCAENASLGRTTKHKGTLYIGDGIKSVIHSIFVDDMKKNGVTTLTDTKILDGEKGLTVPVDMGDYLGVIDFNHDMLFVLDGHVIEAGYRLAKSDAAKKGPIDAVYDAKRKQLLILNSIAGSVDVLKVQAVK